MICGNKQMSFMASKFEVARFDGTGNFGLWQMRMKYLLAQHGISRALNKKKPTKVDDNKWDEMQVVLDTCATIRLSLRSDHVPCHG